MSNCISVLFRKGKHHGLALLCTLLVTAFAVTGAFAAEPKVRVLATTYPVYLLTRAVAQASPDIQVDLLIPAQAGCPHDYALTPKDMQKLAQANIVVINGLGLEAFLEKPLASAGKKIAIIDSSAGANAIVEEHDNARHADHDKADAGHSDRHGHDHGGVNPHAFSSPLQAAIMTRNIGRGLAAAAPDAAKNCPQTADAYAAKLEALGQRLAAVGAHAANKNVVALHDGMAYLVRDAGLNLVDVIQQDEEAQPSAARLLALVKIIKESKPVVLMGEPQYSDKPVLALSAETGVPAVQLDPLASGSTGVALDHYETVMSKNCATLEKYFGK